MCYHFSLQILEAMQQSNNAKANERAMSTELEDINKLTTTVIRAHMETCEFTKGKTCIFYYVLCEYKIS